MKDIFISHVEEDAGKALQIAESLEKEGFTTWYYERDSTPGVSYLIETGQAIEDCSAVILLISMNSVASHQVTREVERAHECEKPFIPILIGIAHEDFIALQPTWRQAIGTKSSIEIPPEGIESILPRVIKGLEKMGLRQAEGSKRSKQVLTFQDEIKTDDVGGIFVVGYKPSITRIFGRKKLSEECATLISSGKSDFLCLYGVGGIGKSSLASLVFSILADDTKGKFKNCIWYDLGHEPDPETALLQLITITTGGNVANVGREKLSFDMLLNLARAGLRNRHTLVVFDNLDSAFAHGFEAGTFADNRWPDLFRALIGAGSGIIVTSRQMPRIQIQSAEFIQVEGIAPEYAVQLMCEAGLKDPEQVLIDACKLLQGHPMALSALAATVTRKPRYRGLLSKAGDIIEAVRRCPDQSQNPITMIEELINPAYLTNNKYEIITAMAVLYRPETASAIAALIPEISLEGVEDGLDDLTLRSLVQVDLNADPLLYQLQPLVKEVTRKLLEEPDQYHNRAYEYYISGPWDPHTRNPNDVEHLRLAALHALELKDIDRTKSILYGDICLSEKLMDWGRYDKACPLHQQEFELVKESGEITDQMRSAGLLSTCLIRLGHTAEALDFAIKALDMAVQCDDKTHQCIYRTYIGKNYYLTGDYDKAHTWLTETLEITEDIDTGKWEGRIKGIIGQIYSMKGDFDKALEWLEDTHRIAAEVGDRSTEVEVSGNIGHIYFLRGRYDEAMRFLIRSLPLAVEYGDKLNESKISTHLGLVQMAKGDFKEAHQKFKQALKVDIEIGNRRHEGALRALIAKEFLKRGEYRKALDQSKKAVDIAVEVGSRAAEAFRTGQIGEVYLALGEFDQAMGHLLKAYNFSRESGDKPNECAWRGKIGEVYLCQGNHDAALDWLQKALDIAAELEDMQNESEWSGLIGEVWLAQGNYDHAEEWLNRALNIAMEIGDPLLEKRQRQALGRLSLETGNPSEAVAHFERVLQITKQLGMTDEIIQSVKGEFR